MKLMRLAWDDRSPLPRLEREAVHVWSVPVGEGISAVGAGLEDLTPEEQARARRYRLGRIRDQFVTSRSCLRRLLGAYLGRPARDVPILYEGSGKPRLAEGGLHFNLSHAGAWTLIAVARQRVGVDVEQAHAIPNMEGLVARFFAPAEGDAFRALPLADRPRAFFHAWTCKEAVIKGVGLSIESLSEFEVELRADQPAGVRSSRHPQIDPGAWWVEAWELACGYAAAVAVERGGAGDG